ncbi:MAG: hypothetical protein RH917_06225 [Lacipirellulaceae bacterium]
MARVFGAFQTEKMSISFERRSDTRMYFDQQSVNIDEEFGHCVGAFFLINPGTAKPIEERSKSAPWGALTYNDERLLPHLEKVLDHALGVVHAKSKAVENELKKHAYIQILNLAYIRDALNAGCALGMWRELVKSKKDTDDVPHLPRGKERLRFVVFGWGDSYKPDLDEPRIVRVLEECVGSDTQLFFPSNAAIKGDEEIRQETACVDGLREQLRRHRKPAPAYPCGARNAGKRFLDQYCKSMGPLIGEALCETS